MRWELRAIPHDNREHAGIWAVLDDVNDVVRTDLVFDCQLRHSSDFISELLLRKAKRKRLARELPELDGASSDS